VEVAGLWAGSYWATFTIGRIMAGLLTRRFGMANLLKAGFLLALGGSVLLWWNPFPQASILAVLRYRLRHCADLSWPGLGDERARG
jgi:hypothetical protein